MNQLRLLSLLLVLGLASAAFGQGSLTPPGAPAPSMKSLQDVWDKLDSVSQAQKYTAHAFSSAPASAGGKVTVAITNILAGQLVKLQNITVNTYNDSSPVAYIRFLVKEAASTSRIMTLQIPLGAAMNDPVTNTRTGSLDLSMWVNGGSVFDVALGDVHSMTVVIQSSAGASATGSWVLTGLLATP